MAKLGTMSASKLGYLNGCAYAYKLKYIDKIKVPQNIRLAFGTAIHYKLEEFYKKNFKSEDSFANSWEFYWFLVSTDKDDQRIEEKYKKYHEKIKKRYGNLSIFDEKARPFILAQYKKLGSKILKRFYQRHKGKDKPQPIEVEKRFTINFDGFKLTGNIDRIDEFKNGLCISDYKTDKKCPSKDDLVLRKHHQFTIYYLAFKQIYGKDPTGIFMYHLRSGNVIPTTRTEDDFIYLKDSLEKAKRIIESDDFQPFYGFHCNLCDYIKVCQEREVESNLEEIIDQEETDNFWGIEEDSE